MGLLGSLEKKFDELKKDIGLGDGRPQQQQQQYHHQQGYPGAQQHAYYPPPQGYQQPPPPGQQQWGPPPHQQQWSYASQPQQQWSPPASGAYQQQPQQWAPPIPRNKPNARPQQTPPLPPHPQQQWAPPGPPQEPSSGNPTDYWQPLFHPSRSVSADFSQKLGNGPDGWGNQELEHYTSSPANSFYTADHKLVLRAISNPSDPNPETRYTSARLVSHQKLSQPRGCLTAVLTVPAAPGIWPAFWLLPTEPFAWPTDGEIDIAESWNAEPTNHSCLHWGHYNGADHDKHRVVDTPLPGLSHRCVKYEFGWEQDEGSGRGRYVWWIDGRAVMRAAIPEGLRRMRDWTVVLNVAMGGSVCGRVRPGPGQWDLVVHELRMSGECDGGWARFEQGWREAPEGRKM